MDFRPRWDCHGLPIEQKVLQSTDPPPPNDAVPVRSRARELAQRTVRSWGVMADWERPYLTKDADFARRQIRLFGKLFRDGMVFRRHRCSSRGSDYKDPPPKQSLNFLACRRERTLRRNQK